LSPLEHMMYALGQMVMADAAITPGCIPNIATAELHTSTFHLLAAIAEINNPQINEPGNIQQTAPNIHCPDPVDSGVTGVG